jgi:hypothetical protein
MENQLSPLQKYKRQPKLYIDLPSKGQWNGPNAKATELAVYSMTAGDEIAVKTPDALYSGLATVKLIKSCVPEIPDPWLLPSIDVDYILTAIRLASYGDSLTLSAPCTSCSEVNEYAVDVQTILDHYTKADFSGKVRVDDFVFDLRPLYFKESNELQKESFYTQRILIQQVQNMPENDEKQSLLNDLYDKLNDLTKSTIIAAVFKITTPDGETETHHEFIKDFLENSEGKYFKKIRETFESNNSKFTIPSFNVECGSCGSNFDISPSMDYSNFFAEG